MCLLNVQPRFNFSDENKVILNGKPPSSSHVLRGADPLLLQCCFTSTEVRWLIRDGDRGGRGRKSEGSPSDTARKRPERPWTAARTMEVLRRCPQRLVHCAIAVSTAVLGQSHKDNVRCTAVDEQLEQLEAKEVQLSQPSSTSLLMISSELT